MQEDFIYPLPNGEQISLSLYPSQAFGRDPLILYIHGFKGFKAWGFVPWLGTQFAQAGFSFVCFNFSHNGIGPDGESFTELEKFKANTFSREVAETRAILNMIHRTDFLGRDQHGPVGLMGHSRGGGISILSARQSPIVKALSTWASVSTFARFSSEAIAAWRSNGFHPVKNSRTGQVFHLGMDMLADIDRNASGSLHILNATQRLQMPFLIVHGQNDETVPHFEAEQLNIFAPPGQTELRLIPGGTHTFGARHPFDGVPAPLQTAFDQTLAFFQQHLMG